LYCRLNTEQSPSQCCGLSVDDVQQCDCWHHHFSWLTNTIHPTLKMTPAQAVETPATNNSPPQNHTHPDDHTIRTTDTPGFKPFKAKIFQHYDQDFNFTYDLTTIPQELFKTWRIKNIINIRFTQCLDLVAIILICML